MTVLVLTATCGFGWIVISYEGYAITRGLMIGQWFTGPLTWLQALAYIGVVGAIILSLVASVWWASIIVLVGANILARIVLSIFNAQAQVIGALGLFVGIIISGFLVLI